MAKCYKCGKIYWCQEDLSDFLDKPSECSICRCKECRLLAKIEKYGEILLEILNILDVYPK